jgi:hypothetical protein
VSIYTRRYFCVGSFFFAATCEEREDVVRAAVACLDDEREIRGKAAVVGVACLVLVLHVIHTYIHKARVAAA